MRLGIARGSVVLNQAIPALRGVRLVIVEPVNAANLEAANGLGGGKPLIVADRLGPATGQMVAYVEGRTAASPFYPQDVPIDAYCAAIVQNIDFRPPTNEIPSASEVHS